MKQSTFHVAGLYSSVEEKLIRNRLKLVAGIERLDFKTLHREVVVTHHLEDEERILSALESLGLRAQIKTSLRKTSEPGSEESGLSTRGLEVTDVIPLRAPGQPLVWQREAILELAASLKAASRHPAGASKPCAALPIENFQSIAGRGVSGEIKGQKYFLGNRRLAEENGVCSVYVEVAIERLEADGKTAVVLSTEQYAFAVLGVTDKI